MIYNIAIDGPAGAGKSTIARRVAKNYHLFMSIQEQCIVPWHFTFSQKNVDRTNTEQIGEVCQNAEISIEYQNGEQIVLLNGENVNAYLRTRRGWKYGVCKFCRAACPRKTAQSSAQTCKRYECSYGWA